MTYYNLTVFRSKNACGSLASKDYKLLSFNAANGLHLGYLYAIKDLMDSGSPFGAVLSLIKQVSVRTVRNGSFDECEKRTNELVREIDAYVDANVIYVSKNRRDRTSWSWIYRYKATRRKETCGSCYTVDG